MMPKIEQFPEFQSLKPMLDMGSFLQPSPSTVFGQAEAMSTLALPFSAMPSSLSVQAPDGALRRKYHPYFFLSIVSAVASKQFPRYLGLLFVWLCQAP